MAEQKRSYNQLCPLAKALDVVGERWSLLIIRELIPGPKRFRDLLEGLQGIGPNLLAKRLKELEERNVVTNCPVGTAGIRGYCLTEQGRRLEPTVYSLVKWGQPLLAGPSTYEFWLPRWSIVIFGAYLSEIQSLGISGTINFVIGSELFYLDCTEQQAQIMYGRHATPRFSCEMTDQTFLDLVRGRQTWTDLQGARRLRIEGDKEHATRIFSVFSHAPAAPAHLGHPPSAILHQH